MLEKTTFTSYGLEEHRGGWDFTSSWPLLSKHPWIGFGCDQGLPWVLFCGSGLAIGQKNYNARSALAMQAQKKFNFTLIPHIISRCKYNYQRENKCYKGFSCSTDVVIVHKAHFIRPEKKIKISNYTKKVKTLTWPFQRMSYKPIYNPAVCGCGSNTGASYASGWSNEICSINNWQQMPGTEKH